MKKKLAVCTMVLALGSANCLASDFGLSLGFGAGQYKSDVKDVGNGDKQFVQSYPPYSYSSKYTKNDGIFSIEAMYEHDLGENNFVGFKVGFNSWGTEEYKADFYGTYLGTRVDGKAKVKVDYKEFPIAIYYKYTPSKWHVRGGIGLAAGKASGKKSASLSIPGYPSIDGSDSNSVSKTYPFVTAGLEYRFAKHFGLGLDLRYNISAKFKKDELVYRDVSGMQGILAAKVYF